MEVSESNIIAGYYIALQEKYANVYTLLEEYASQKSWNMVPNTTETCQEVSILLGKYIRFLGQHGQVDKLRALFEYDFIDLNCCTMRVARPNMLIESMQHS